MCVQCTQDASNVQWCCGGYGANLPIVRHLDLSTPAFVLIAEEEAGVIDVMFQASPLTDFPRCIQTAS